MRVAREARRTLLTLALLAPLVVVACGDDGGSEPTGVGGGSGASNEAGAAGQSEADTCVRDYELDFYEGDTAGLCEASEVNRCDDICGEVGDALTILCEPDKSGCIYRSTVCADHAECGWIDCWSEIDPEFCADLEPVIEDVRAGAAPRPCVRDSDCSLPATCSRRIYNLMVCDAGEPYQAGAGGRGE